MIDTNGLSVKKHVCQLCPDVEMPEEMLQEYNGYMACAECIEKAEMEASKDNDFVRGLNAGRDERSLQILTLLSGEEYANARKIIVETISKS